MDDDQAADDVVHWDPAWDCNFDPDLDPDWNNNHVVSWEEHVVEALHIVRLHQIIERDPVCGLPMRTRFCRYNLAYFDFDKESSPSRGPPILMLSSRDRVNLADSINIVSFTVLESDMGFPISVYGTVLVRDQVDYKCIYLFKRGRDNPQLITSPEDSIALTDPCRALAVTDGMFFEINLKVKREDSSSDGDDVDFSKGVIERALFVSGIGGELTTRELTSWHSTLELAYTPVPVAVAATLAVNVLAGPREFFHGEVIAWTSGNGNEIVLYNSEVAGTQTGIGAGGSVALSRCLVAVPVKQHLMLRIRVRDGDGIEAVCFKLALDHLDDEHICCRGTCELLVKVEWNAIMNRTEEGVFRHVGDTQLVL